METLSTKVPPSIKQQVEEYAEEIDETQSTAARELLQAGLESEQGTTDIPLLFLAQLLGWVMFAGAFFEADPIVGYVGAGIVLVTILAPRFGYLEP
jgi:hypothetical protein